MNHDVLDPAALAKAASAIEAQYAQLAAPSDFVNLIDAIDAQLERVDDAVDTFVTFQLKSTNRSFWGSNTLVPSSITLSVTPWR